MNPQQILEQALELAKQRLSLFATDPEFLIPPIEICPVAKINRVNTA